MRREVGIGVIGLGWMGQLHSRAYRRLRDHYPDCPAGVRFVSLSESVEERAQKGADLFGFERWTTNWSEVIEDSEVEAVSITTPNYLHREIALAAAEAGKHIWIEKPCGRFPAETYEIGSAVRRGGVMSTIGLMYRNAPVVEYARELIRAEELGEITSYRGCFLADYAADPSGALTWRYKRDYAGLGVLGDIMPHTIDLAHYLIGDVQSVSAQKKIVIKQRPKVPAGMGTGHFKVEDGELEDVENEDYASSLVHFENGAYGIFESSRTCLGPHVRNAFEVNGTKGALAWDFERMNELQLYRVGEKEEGYRTVYAAPEMGGFARFQPGTGISMSYDDLKVIEARNFLTSIAEGEQREPGTDEIVSAMRVVDAMDRSCASDSWETVEKSGKIASA